MDLAPIIVFAYNRPEHLIKVLEALAKNPEAIHSDLFVFIDGPKNEDALTKQKEVLGVAERFKIGYFNKVNIYCSNKNRGLSKAVISGVTNIFEKSDKVIVLEDDSIPDILFLKYMNEALDFYKSNNSIWSIGGYTPPIKIPMEYKYEIIKTQRCSSYAWGTWKNRWQKIDWNVKDYAKFRFDFIQRKKFNYWGSDRSSMLDDQMNQRINSWAIRFDYAMFTNNMYNIVPIYSLVKNIGHDGSGTHSRTNCTAEDDFYVDLNNQYKEINLQNVEVDERIRLNFINFFKYDRVDLIKRYLSNLWVSWRK